VRRRPAAWWLARWWLGHGLGPLVLRWWRRRGLRSRVTITAALGLLVAFAAADLLLFNALRISITRSVDDYARSGATEVAALSNASRLPDPVPVAAGTISIQVLNASGRIVDVSPDADRLVPIVDRAQAAALAASGGAVLVAGGPFDMPALLRVAAVRANGGLLVVAAVPFSEASGSLNVVGRALVIGSPVLFLVFTWAIWIATGSTLRPIAALRRGAARVTGTGVPADLPVPEARDEVRLLALTLNDMLSRLAGAQQRQRALVSDTAHELRSPIASIRTQLEVALDFPDGQDWATTARDVHADVLRLARLAEDLLLLARLDEQAGGPGASPADGSGGGAGWVGGAGGAAGTGGAGGRVRPVDLAALARTVACRYGDARVAVRAAVPEAAGGGAPEAAGGGAPEAAGDCVPETAGGSAPEAPGRGVPEAPDPAGAVVRGDPGRLDRLLVNLVDNAVRYARSAVLIEVRRDGGWVELAVTDDGPGIAADDRERAFDRFARLDGARSRDGAEAGGAGLGLAIVRATAQAYGGTAVLGPAPPGLETGPPGLGTAGPAVRTAAPGLGTAPPPVGTAPPAVRTAPPGLGTAETGAGTAGPGAGTDETRAEADETRAEAEHGPGLRAVVRLPAGDRASPPAR
jgi:signal transduction histidine kinase